MSTKMKKKKSQKEKQNNLVQKFKRGEIPNRKIPQTKLEEALIVLKDEEKRNTLFRQNLGCTLPIHITEDQDTLSYDMMLYLKDMRNCLMERDWSSLARMLSLANPQHDGYYAFMLGLLTKYATILLSYNDEKLLGILAQSVLGEDNLVELLKKQTTYLKHD